MIHQWNTFSTGVFRLYLCCCLSWLCYLLFPWWLHSQVRGLQASHPNSCRFLSYMAEKHSVVTDFPLYHLIESIIKTSLVVDNKHKSTIQLTVSVLPLPCLISKIVSDQKDWVNCRNQITLYFLWIQMDNCQSSTSQSNTFAVKNDLLRALNRL